jgi:hypothetical protein
MRYETFDGLSRRDPKMFMREFKARAKSNNQGADDVKASIFGGLMIKTAQTWFSCLPPNSTLPAIKHAFLSKYEEEGASSRAFTKIKHLRMSKHGSVRKYADTLLELVNKYEPNTSPDTIRDWFITGLPSAIHRFVRIQRPKVKTMEEALEAAQTYVDSEMSQKAIEKGNEAGTSHKKEWERREETENKKRASQFQKLIHFQFYYRYL